MRIAITGATGLLGRNLLFEILKQHLNNLENLEILILGRAQKLSPLEERLDQIIEVDGCDYIGVNQQDRAQFLQKINKCIMPISFDLTQESLGISADDFNLLANRKIDFFFHMAALSDFRNTPTIAAKVFEVNLDGTKKVLKLIQELSIGEFIYTGSAYSAGYTKGEISPDYVNETNSFRNPYEKSKLAAEQYLKYFAKNNKIKYRIFRLTGIGGRLIEPPIGSICKYDIFYGWAIFFLKYKLKIIGSPNKIYFSSVDVPVRIAINFASGMNVVPADYAAKLLWAICLANDNGISYHLVNDIDIPNPVHVKLILDALNIRGWSLVDKEPEDKNGIENFYYETVGKIFTPYVITDRIHYNSDSIVEIREKANLSCPLMNEENFLRLINYAKANYFGLKTG